MAKMDDRHGPLDEHNPIPDIGNDMLRNARAELIRAFFGHENMAVMLMIKVIPLIKQQMENPDREIGGAIDIYVRTGDIKFRTVETGFAARTRAALEKFTAGNEREAAPVLMEALKEFSAAQPDDFREKVLNHPNSVYTRLRQLRDGELEHVSPGSREKIIALTEIGLTNSYFVSEDELQTHKREFAASFHIHSSGEPPSQLDLDTSTRTDFPDVVIAAKPDFMQKGFKLYLVNNHAYEEIYSVNLDR